MRPFGCPVTILNTLDPLGKFQGNVDESFLVGYSVCSKAFRVFNSRTRIVQETLHVNFRENKPNVAGSGPAWLFDIDSLSQTMNYHPVIAENQFNTHTSFQDTEKVGEEGTKTYVLFPVLSDEFKEYYNNSSNGVNAASSLVSTAGQNSIDSTNDFSAAGPSNAVMPNLEDLSHDTNDVVKDQGGISQMFNKDFYTCMFACFLSQEEPKRVHQTLKDPSWIEAMQEELLQFKMQKVWILVDLPYGKRAIGHIQEEGIDYEEVFALVAKIKAIRLFLAYASFMGFPVYQMYVKSTFLYGTIEKDIYVCQPPGFKDPENPNKVYKVVKALYGLHQAPRAWSSGKLASTPIDAEKPLLKDSDGEDVDVHTYRSMIGPLMYLTSSRPDIMFTICACAQFQMTPKVSHLNAVKRIFRYLKGKPYLGIWYPKDSPFDLVAYSDSDYAVVATSLTEAEYVAAASGCAQVLWIQNQLLDYGKVVIEIAVLNIFSDDLPITTNGKTATGKESSNPFTADAAEGFKQIVDFLSGSYIYYALTVSPHIYISCIKQFWNSVSVKRLGDVTRLQALVDRKKIVISEAVIREILQLNDAKGVVCLPNEEIFTGLAQMGYEKPSTKLTFYKAFFSSQWNLVCNVDRNSKFYMYPRFIQLIIQAQVGDLSTHTTRFISPALTQKVFANMRRVGKGFSRVETPLFKGMIADRQPAKEELGAEQVQVDAAVAAAVAAAIVEVVVEDVAEDVTHVATLSPPPHGIPSPPQEPFSPPQQPHDTPPVPTQGQAFPVPFQQVLDTCSALLCHVKHLKQDTVAQRQVESSDDMEDVFNQRRMMNEEEGIELEDDSEVQDVVEVVTTAKLITKVVTAAAYTRTPAETPKVKDKGKGILVKAPKPMKKKDQIEMDAEYARKLQEEIDRDHDGFNKDRYQGMKKRPQTESEARKNMMIYLKNTAGYKMDFFKGMTNAQICPIFQARFDENIRFLFKSRGEMEAEDQEIIKSINETPVQKVAKRRKLSEEAQEAEDLRKRLEVVEDKDDDVFVEATSFASKVPVVDYQIVLIDNKPRWTRFYMKKSKECSWFGIGEKMEVADFIWCSCHYYLNSLALPIG
nr:putative ribonuclease H-like domain-containing protein [Tanacetum cinerariifolium]